MNERQEYRGNNHENVDKFSLFVTDESLDSATFSGSNAQRNGDHDSRETCNERGEKNFL